MPDPANEWILPQAIFAYSLIFICQGAGYGHYRPNHERPGDAGSVSL